MRCAILAVAVIAGALLAGCSGDSHMGSTPQSMLVSPADGATGVRLDTGIALTFAAPAVRAVVERDFHVISERAMEDTCSMPMEHGTMMEWMADTSMMRHMSQEHALPGHFSWNPAGTGCTFQPDSMMTPQTRYMIHMGPEMMDMMRGMGGGMMPGHGAGMMSDHMMLHFTTMDTTGGHAGHH